MYVTLKKCTLRKFKDVHKDHLNIVLTMMNKFALTDFFSSLNLTICLKSDKVNINCVTTSSFHDFSSIYFPTWQKYLKNIRITCLELLHK